MIAYFDCFSGASGDMILGALIDAGASPDKINEELGKVLPGLSLTTAPVSRAGLASLCVSVEPAGARAGKYSELHELIDRAPLDEAVKQTALRILGVLAAAEATVHGVEIEDVHFHEIAGDDTIADVVGVSVALEELGVSRCYCSAVSTGTGTIETAHGVLPTPAPAVLELLHRSTIRYLPVDAELVTPTGAAILAALCEFAPPAELFIARVGYGAGTKDLAGGPNVVRVTVGEQVDTGTAPHLEQAVVLEATLDDQNPEIVAYAMEQLLGAGALDVWMTPAIGKKGRQATVLAALSSPQEVDRLREVLFRETSTLGVRSYRVDRSVLERKTVEVEVLGYAVRVKVGMLHGEEVNVAPEYSDCAEVAAKTSEPLKRIYDLALEQYRAAFGGRERI